MRNVQAVRHEREVVRKAIKMLSEAVEAERAELQRQAIAARLDEWRALVREIAVTVLTLHRVGGLSLIQPKKPAPDAGIGPE